MAKYGTISEPTADLGALYKTCQDLKRVLESMLGTTGGGDGRVARVYVDRETPKSPLPNDLWVRPSLLAGEKNILSYYFQGNWVKFGEGP